MKAEISEIFYSIQGEGILAGVRQLFIRFRGCNLDCYYCDTTYNENCIDYTSGKEVKNPVERDYIQKIIDNSERIHSVTFTGGEPMLYGDFISSLNKTKKFYLESNMTLPERAKQFKFFDFIAGDLKLRNVTSKNYNELYERTIKCFKILRNTRRRLTFCKIVLPQKFDIHEVSELAKGIEDYVHSFVLQPVFGVWTENILKLQEMMLEFKDTRIIPQIHKYLGVR